MVKLENKVGKYWLINESYVYLRSFLFVCRGRWYLRKEERKKENKLNDYFFYVIARVSKQIYEVVNKLKRFQTMANE